MLQENMYVQRCNWLALKSLDLTVKSKHRLVNKEVIKDTRLNSITCTFCNYISYVTGKHVCPTMQSACSKKS